MRHHDVQCTLIVATQHTHACTIPGGYTSCTSICPKPDRATNFHLTLARTFMPCPPLHHSQQNMHGEEKIEANEMLANMLVRYSRIICLSRHCCAVPCLSQLPYYHSHTAFVMYPMHWRCLLQASIQAMQATLQSNSP